MLGFGLMVFTVEGFAIGKNTEVSPPKIALSSKFCSMFTTTLDFSLAVWEASFNFWANVAIFAAGFALIEGAKALTKALTHGMSVSPFNMATPLFLKFITLGSLLENLFMLKDSIESRWYAENKRKRPISSLFTEYVRTERPWFKSIIAPRPQTFMAFGASTAAYINKIDGAGTLAKMNLALLATAGLFEWGMATFKNRDILNSSMTKRKSQEFLLSGDSKTSSIKTRTRRHHHNPYPEFKTAR